MWQIMNSNPACWEREREKERERERQRGRGRERGWRVDGEGEEEGGGQEERGRRDWEEREGGKRKYPHWTLLSGKTQWQRLKCNRRTVRKRLENGRPKKGLKQTAQKTSENEPKVQILWSDFGRADSSRILISEPADVFADFVAGFSRFCGKSAKKNPSCRKISG